MLAICFVLLPGIVSILGALCMSQYRVSREGHKLVKEALSRRKLGDEPLTAEETAKIEAMMH